jgi:uracil-DNA glycosylase family 4
VIVRTVGPPDAKIFCVGEAPGEHEARLGTPFVESAPAGKVLTSLLNQAGIARFECLVGNVARERPPGNDIMFYFEDSKGWHPKPILQQWILDLKREIETFKPNIVIALGDTALWALAGVRGISKFRGAIMESALVPGQKMMATYHPSAILHEPTYKVEESYKKQIVGIGYVTLMDLKKAQRESLYAGVPEDKRTFIGEPTLAQWTEYMVEILSGDESKPISVDLETTVSHISRIGIATSENMAMSLKLLSGLTPLYPERDEVNIWDLIGQVLMRRRLIFHNASYDTAILVLHHGIHCYKNIAIDTQIAAHCLWPELPRDLGFITSLCLNVPPWKHMSKENAGLYNASDTANTYGCAKVMWPEMKRMEVLDTYKKELSQIEPSVMLQLQGIPVDKERLERMRNETKEKLNETEAVLAKITKREINYASPKQVANLLYIDLGMPVQYKRRKSVEEDRKLTTDDEALNRLNRKYKHPILSLILAHRELSKLLSTYLDFPISPEGRIHTSYNITGTPARWSSSESIILPFGPGNLQNIHTATRRCYPAEQGYVWLQADYVQAEAVVTAYLTGNSSEKNIFNKGGDIHRFTYAHMYSISEDAVTSEQRRIGKTLRHATNYSAGPKVVAAELAIDEWEAKDLLKRYLDSNPLLGIWYMTIQSQLKRDRTLKTPLGRKHKFMGRWGDSLFRSAYAYLPQATVGDMLNDSLVELYQKYGRDIRIALQLHDAIYSWVHESEIEDWIKVHKKIMVKPIEVNNDTMTIQVDFKTGDTWGEMKDVK